MNSGEQSHAGAPGRPETTTDSAVAAAIFGGARGGRFRTLVLGLEVWALAALVPFVELPSGRPSDLLLLALPLALLAAGELLRLRATLAAQVILLAGVPLALSLGAAARPELAGHDAWTGALGPLVGISLLFYLGIVLHSFARPAATRATGWQPVPEAAWSRRPSGRVLAATTTAIVLFAGIVAVAILPFAIPRATLEAAFPLAADDARTLGIAVAGGLFSVALGAVVGPSLRARRVGDQARERVTRSVVASLVVAGLAAIAYAWLVLAD